MGMGGSRAAYSSVCGEFASYGFVVCAMEHGDGSGARTLVNTTRPKVSAAAQNERRQVDSSTNQVLTSTRSMWSTSFSPKDDPNNTSPGHRIDRELRKAQIEMRLAELEEAYTAMATICAGQGESLAEKKAP